MKTEVHLTIDFEMNAYDASQELEEVVKFVRTILSAYANEHTLNICAEKADA